MALFTPPPFALNTFIDKGFKSNIFSTFSFSSSNTTFSSLYNRVSFSNLTGFQNLSGFLFHPLRTTLHTTIEGTHKYNMASLSLLLSSFISTIEHLNNHLSVSCKVLYSILNSTIGGREKHSSSPYIPLFEVANSGIEGREYHYFLRKKDFSATAKTVQNIKIQVNKQ